MKRCPEKSDGRCATAPAQVLYGDDFLIAEALKELRDGVGPDELRDANSHRLAGADASPQEVQAICNAVPFLAEYRLVIVEGLLGRFESGPPRRGARGGRQGSPSSRASTTGWDDMARYISNDMPPTTMLAFVDERVSRSNPMLTILKPAAAVKELTTPSGEALARWIKERAASKGAQITPGAIRLMSQFVGGNLRVLDGELEKLSLYARRPVERPIEDSDVRALVSQAREANIFAGVDALMDGRSGPALQNIQQLRSDGADFSYIVAMTARQLRLVALAKDLLDRGHKQAELGSKLGIRQEFAVRRTADQAKKRSWSGIRQLYGKLLETDLAVKEGRLDEDVALELLASMN